MIGSDRGTGMFDDASPQVDRFGLLLLSTLLAVITLSLVDLGAPGRGWLAQLGAVVVTCAIGATLSLSLRASGVRRRYVRIADAVVGAGVVVTVVVLVLSAVLGETGGLAVRDAPAIAWVVLSAGAPVVVVRRLVRHRRVTLQTLLGAVSAYLLIALAFALAFLITDGWTAEPFFGQDEPTTSFMYYSLVVITTLGFGDLAAAQPFGRLLTTMEALLGQVYLVTFVGMVVGVFVSQRTTDPAE